MQEAGERGVAILQTGTGGDAPRELQRNDLSGITDLLAERGRRYGNFEENAEMAQVMKGAWRGCPNFPKMPAVMKEAGDHTLSKMSRMGNGDWRHLDNVDDIIGYWLMVKEELKSR